MYYSCFVEQPLGLCMAVTQISIIISSREIIETLLLIIFTDTKDGWQVIRWDSMLPNLSSPAITLLLVSQIATSHLPLVCKLVYDH